MPAGASGWADAAAPRTAATAERSETAATAERSEEAGHAAQERPGDAFPATGVVPAAATAPTQDSDRPAGASGGTGSPASASTAAASSAAAATRTAERSDRLEQGGQEQAGQGQAGQERPAEARSNEAGTAAGAAAASAAPTTTAVPTVTAESDDEPFAASLRDEPQSTYQAFWFAVPQTRHALDEATGAIAFTLQPGAWILALEDRGHEFLVQDTDGRLGVLRDLAHVERA